MKSKAILGILILLGFGFMSFADDNIREKGKRESSKKDVPTYSEEEIISRLESQNSPVEI